MGDFDRMTDNIRMPPPLSPLRSPFVPAPQHHHSPTRSFRPAELDLQLLYQPTRTSTRKSIRMSDTSSNSSGPFTESVKQETRGRCGSLCWSCNIDTCDIAHVVAKEDRQTQIWERANVFDFKYKSSNNAITLCQRCHKEFDYTSDPGWVFFPTDLGYFIRFEEADRRRRASYTNHTNRRVPTAEEYEAYQRHAGLLPRDTEGDGGLYRRVWLRFFTNCGFGITQTAFDRLTEPKQWYGAPLASIRRAFAALGSVRISVLDPAIEQQLLQLRRLYFENIDGQEMVIEPVLKSRYTLNKRRFEEDSDTMQSPQKRRAQSMPDITPHQTEQGSQQEDPHVEDDQTYIQQHGNSGPVSFQPRFHQLQEMEMLPEFSTCLEWVLGPASSANEPISPAKPQVSQA